MPSKTSILRAVGALLLITAWPALHWSVAVGEGRPATGPSDVPQSTETANPKCLALRLAITDLIDTFGDRYPKGAAYLDRLEDLEAAVVSGVPAAEREFEELRRQALFDNPLLDFGKLIVLKRKRGALGLPTNHQCNYALEHTGYGNEIVTLSPVRPGGKIETLYRPERDLYVGEIDVDYDARRLLFSMPAGGSFEVHEIRTDGTGLRQVSRGEEGVDNFDACWLPDGRIVYSSTASYTGVPCWHGRERACSLYRMNADGSDVRQLCFDQDLDLNASVLPNGQIVYSRWEYSGTMHIYLRPLMVMNPDGTNQRAVYGSNSHYPNSLFFPRGIPGTPNKMVALLCGYHGVHRMGELALLDLTAGWYGADGIVQRITHSREPIDPIVRDAMIEHRWPKFLHPYPLSEKYFLAAGWRNKKDSWGIYLVDVFDNMVPVLFDERFDFFEPLAVQRTPRPPVIPDRTDQRRDDAVVYLHDVYAGPGLAGVPRGSVQRLRIVAYTFGYPGMAGPDKIGHGGPWDAMRILGTVPVGPDGSVAFRVPANTPIAVQPLDAEGKALQLMRSWYTAMPGEKASCVGCHEQPKETPAVRFEVAATQKPLEIEPWYGPMRGFDFEREVQPVLDKYCVACHNDRSQGEGGCSPDLRAEGLVENYQGLPLSTLGANRLDESLYDDFPACTPPTELHGKIRMLYTPAYEALIPYIRRVNVEDDVALLVPGEYHADTSELTQMLKKGHQNVKLDREAWDRLITWIDLNGPCHGTWSDVAEIPHGADRRRLDLARRYGGPSLDPEAVPESIVRSVVPVVPEPLPKPDLRQPDAADLAVDAVEARRRQEALPAVQTTFDLGRGVTLRLVPIPAGEFLMGSSRGEVDEYPAAGVSIDRRFMIGACEITNRQFRRFDPSHTSGVFTKRSIDRNGPGVTLDRDDQPAVRVSWQQAMDYCRWLSSTTGAEFTLPTEAQWEYACRAGSATELSYGSVGDDFSAHANVADSAIDRLYTVTGGVVVLQEIPSDTRFDDGAITTSDVGTYRPNAWGLFDTHGNAAEWTLSAYRPYPYRDDDRNSTAAEGRKVVRGGSFYDRPKRCRSSFRLSYPAWQPVHNVGFRVVARWPDRSLAAKVQETSINYGQ